MVNENLEVDKKSLFLNELMKSKGIKSIAYHKSGIKKTTFFKWQKEDANFKNKIKEIEDKWIDVVETQLLELISKGDRAAIMFYLKAKAKDRGYY
jgi:CRISPR/Cas system Type II protein with McrA/HNH and RuvC-like nuclease domain